MPEKIVLTDTPIIIIIITFVLELYYKEVYTILRNDSVCVVV